MPSVQQLQSDIARLKREETVLRKKLSDADASAAKARSAARDKRTRAARTSSSSMINNYFREAERLEKRAADEEKKAADAAKKLADNAGKQAAKMKALDTANRDAARRQDQEDVRRRQTETRHAREVARLAQPTLRHIHEVRVIAAPKTEQLRVLYLAANPGMDLRVDVEVRAVREAVRKSLHRDLIEIDHRPAATPEDLLDGINDMRPHVVHFAGHGGGASLLFDDAQIHDAHESDHNVGRALSFDLLGRALRATDSPPTVLILNACDTLRGAEVLLDVVPTVVAMADSVSDLAAGVFAARFYAAVGSAQPLGAALAQAIVAVEAAGLEEGWKAEALVREGVDVDELVLVRSALGLRDAATESLVGSLPDFPELTWEDFQRGSELARRDVSP